MSKNSITEEARPVAQRTFRSVSTLDVVELTDSEEDNVVDLTVSLSDSEDNEEEDRCTTRAFQPNTVPNKDDAGSQFMRNPSLANIFHAPTGTPVTMEPLYLDDDESVPDTEQNDGAILVLDETKSTRKPDRIGTDLQNILNRPTYTRPLIAKSNNVPKPRFSRSHAALEREKRVKYAQQLFQELNEAVFKNGLPQETKLSWNKRLLTTAGRAKWHKNKEGSDYTEIELSEKIVDCNERIRNTLSHEMCHLATWVIDGDPKQGHGRLWKRWASKVMKKQPEIQISTRHNYKISYPYQWRCEKCAKIYGRFSKSIRPAECACGYCKEGGLVPLFSVKQKVCDNGGDNTAAAIRMPLALEVLDDGHAELNSESEVEVLLTTFKSVTIN